MKRTIKPFPQRCVITKEKEQIESYCGNQGANGYKLYNKNNEFIGVVLLDPKYEGRAVIRFRNIVKGQYGVWHLIQQNYSFAYIQNKVLLDGSLSIDIE